MNGGYVMIDCAGIDLLKGETPQTITGLYKKVQDAMKTGKPIYAGAMIWGSGKPVTPVQVFAIQFDDMVICTASTLQVRVTSGDIVTIVNMAPAVNASVETRSTAKKK